jgi:hypothetical protein
LLIRAHKFHQTTVVGEARVAEVADNRNGVERLLGGPDDFVLLVFCHGREELTDFKGQDLLGARGDLFDVLLGALRHLLADFLALFKQ